MKNLEAKTSDKLSAQSLLSLRHLHSARLSPDGTRLAYCVSVTDVEERIEFRILDLSSDREIFFKRIFNLRSPSWSPDGSQLALVSDDGLRILSIPELELSETFLPRHFEVRGEATWSADGSRLAIAVALREQRDGWRPRRIECDIYRADSIGALDNLSQEIMVVELASRRLRTVTANLGFCSAPAWNPLDNRILFLAAPDLIPFATYSQRLLTIDTQTGEVKEITDESWFIDAARWARDGRRIIVVGAKDSTLPIPIPRIWVLNQGSIDLRTSSIASEIGARLTHDMPSRQLLGGNPILVLEDDTVVAAVQVGGAVELWRVTLSGPARVEAILRGERCLVPLGASTRCDRLLFAATDMLTPLELWLSSIDGADHTQITFLNEDVLKRWSRPIVNRFSVRSEGGFEIDAWHMAPPQNTSPLPTILFIHGGPFAAVGNAYRYDFEMLVSQGFGLVFANFRGSAGYGENFMRAIVGDWGRNGFPDHMAVIDAVVARGYADPERLGIWGHSHGGFATCWVVCQTDRFKAAVAEAAFTDFTTLYYTSDVRDVWSRDLGGRPHEIPEVYRERSPMTYASNCRTPTLLLHGEDDLRCPISEVEKFHRVLRDVGCEVVLLKLPGCSHNGDSIGPVPARVAQNQALLDWFGRLL